MNGNVNISGFITDQTSYGLVTLNIIKELSKSLDINVYSEGHSNISSEIQFKEIINKLLHKPINKFSDTLLINHAYNMHKCIGRGDQIGLTFFELNKFTDNEKASLECLDTLIVTSEWAKNICESNLSVNVEKCPIGVDREIFNEVDYKPDVCRFITIGKWEKRKNQRLIFESFKKIFKNDKKYELTMLFDSPFLSRSKYDAFKKEFTTENTRVIDRTNSLSNIAKLLQQSFCFISHSRAEGWNMPLLEAMSCGKFCISPNYSGESEFVTPKNCSITDVLGLETAKDGVWFGVNELMNNGEWAILCNNSLCNNIKKIADEYNSDSILNKEGINTAKKFNWQNTAKTIKGLI